MTAADAREVLEAECWRSQRLTGRQVSAILAAADAYAKEAATAAVRKAREAARPKPAPGEKKPPTVHWTLPGSPRRVTACKPGDWSSAGWSATSDPHRATCQSCRARPEWQEAVKPPPVLAVAPPPAPPDDRMAVTPDGDLKRVSEFASDEKWWCDGEECDGEYAAKGPHVHAGCGYGTLAVDLQTGYDERWPGYVKRDGDKRPEALR